LKEFGWKLADVLSISNVLETTLARSTYVSQADCNSSGGVAELSAGCI